MSTAEALLFDLGGVVIEIDFGRALARWAAASAQPVDTLRSRFSFDDPYMRHERGEIEAAEYFAALRASLGVELTDGELADGWCDIYLGMVPGMAGLLERVGRQVPTYGFTNTNTTHLSHCARTYPDLFRHFRRVFTSCTMGLRKPEAAAFAAIGKEIGVPLDRILFFDDTLENVEAARAVGMPAVHVRSFDDVAAAVDWIG